MRIESSPPPTPQVITEYPEWQQFFQHFINTPSEEEKEAIIHHFVQHLAHLIHQQMQRMVNVYKKMREEHSSYA